MARWLSGWWNRTGSELLWSSDAVGGISVGCAALIGGYLDPTIIPGPSLLMTEVVLGGAILAVVLTTLAILVAFLGEEYIALLEKSVTVKKAILPYQAVAVSAAAQVLCALAGVMTWKVAQDWGRDVIFSVTAGLVVCSVIGTVQIVNITAAHGRRRARIPEIREAALRAVRDRDQKTGA